MASDGRGPIALYLAAYLYGSIPVVYLLGRGRGIDLRRRGSGNVGGSNLWATAGTAYGLLGWLADASKGYVPVRLARRLGMDEGVCRIAGVCGLAGQCWPLFLRFRGGRGISAFLGAALAIDRRAWRVALLPMIGGTLWRLAPLMAGRGTLTRRLRTTRSRAVPLGCALGVLAYPIAVARGTRGRHTPGPAPLLLAGIVAVRRLTAPLPDDATAGPVRQPTALLYRLLYDRNTKD